MIAAPPPVSPTYWDSPGVRPFTGTRDEAIRLLGIPEPPSQVGVQDAPDRGRRAFRRDDLRTRFGRSPMSSQKPGTGRPVSPPRRSIACTWLTAGNIT